MTLSANRQHSFTKDRRGRRKRRNSIHRHATQKEITTTTKDHLMLSDSEGSHTIRNTSMAGDHGCSRGKNTLKGPYRMPHQCLCRREHSAVACSCASPETSDIIVTVTAPGRLVAQVEQGTPLQHPLASTTSVNTTSSKATWKIPFTHGTMCATIFTCRLKRPPPESSEKLGTAQCSK